MKKIFVLILLVAFALPAYAATEISGTSIGGSAFTPSTKVKVFCSSNASAYGSASGHLNGDKSYTTTSTSATLTPAAKAKGTDIGAGAIPSGWDSSSS